MKITKDYLRSLIKESIDEVIQSHPGSHYDVDTGSETEKSGPVGKIDPAVSNIKEMYRLAGEAMRVLYDLENKGNEDIDIVSKKMLKVRDALEDLTRSPSYDKFASRPSTSRLDGPFPTKK